MPKTSRIEQAFERYRREAVRTDLPSCGLPGDHGRALDVLPAWAMRYIARRAALEVAGSFDPVAGRLLRERSLAADARSTELPDWDTDARDYAAQSVRSLIGLRLSDLHPDGPSVRRLWAEARARGASPWEFILEWARMPVPEPGPALPRQWVAREVSFRPTGDPDLPWEAEVDGHRWQVRLEDYPERRLYTLLVDGIEQGGLQDWPKTWDRAPERPRAAPAVKAAAGAAAKWLDRYVAGEHEAVWAEMTALGDGVREELEPARAVARELMRRVRHDLELLVPRLQALGYGFFDGSPPADPLRVAIGPQGSTGGPVPGGVFDLSGLLGQLGRLGPSEQGPMRRLVEALGRAGAAVSRGPRPPPEPLPAPARGLARRLAKLERRGIVLPLSFEAFVLEVGGVDLIGAHPTLCPGGTTDPLSILPMSTGDWAGEIEEAAAEWERGDDPFELELGLGPDEKPALLRGEGVDADLAIGLPNAGADAVLTRDRDGRTLVTYLRDALRCGGFAGWKGHPSPPAELRELTDGFVPF